MTKQDLFLLTICLDNMFYLTYIALLNKYRVAL